jgi:hypothetical protein
MTLASRSKQAQIYLLASYEKGASVMLSQLHISNVGQYSVMLSESMISAMTLLAYVAQKLFIFKRSSTSTSTSIHSSSILQLKHAEKHIPITSFESQIQNSSNFQ